MVKIGQIWQATVDVGGVLNWNSYAIYQVLTIDNDRFFGGAWSAKCLYDTDINLYRDGVFYFPNSTETAKNWRLGSMCDGCKKFFLTPETISSFKCWRCELGI